MNKIKVLIADDIEETRKVITKILSREKERFEVVGEASDGMEVLKQLNKLKPHVVLMDINMPKMNGLEATERITNEFPRVVVIIMSVQAENEYLKRAMFCGAKEYIIKPFDYDVLVNTISATYERNINIITRQKTKDDSKYEGKIISFYSSKGGVGKSILAINTAITLSQRLNKKTLLIDMDLQFGDISMMINQYTNKTIVDIIDDGQLESAENIIPYLHTYDTFMDVLLAPRNPEASEYITKEIIKKMLDILKKQYDMIIIDTGVNFNDTTLYILDISEIILFTSTMDIASLKNTKLGLGVMQTLNYDNDKVKLVINSVSTQYGISIKDIEQSFKDNIYIKIPEDMKTVKKSINKGIPFCAENKNKSLKIVKAILSLCEKITK